MMKVKEHRLNHFLNIIAHNRNSIRN
jgi:hypothetical protein